MAVSLTGWPVAGDRMPGQIDDQGTGSDGGRLVTALGTGMPKRDADAGQQFLDAERLGEVVVCALVQRGDLVGLAFAHRQHDDRNLRPLAQP